MITFGDNLHSPPNGVTSLHIINHSRHSKSPPCGGDLGVLHLFPSGKAAGVCLIVFSFLWFDNSAAQNLIPNGDFEQYSTCQTSVSQLGRALYWTNPMISSTPDYFNACNSNTLCSVPINLWGYEPARSGVAYAAIGTAVIGSDNPMIPNSYREYAQMELLDMLIADTEYCIQFHVSACDSFNYVSNNIGVYFSKVEINDTCYKCTLPYIPQFENQLANLSSRNGWTEVSGTYTAAGGERYIVIGNFKDSIATVATYTGWVTGPSKFYSGYYLDDVSLTICDTIIGIKENQDNSFLKLHPNPSSGLFTLESKNSIINGFQVFDALGNLVYENAAIDNNETVIRAL